MNFVERIQPMGSKARLPTDIADTPRFKALFEEL